MVLIAVCAWQMRKGDADDVYRRTLKMALPIVLVSTLVTGFVGHLQGQLLVKQQPMKMAAAEALFETKGPAPLSLFATGSWAPNPERTNVDIQVPHLLSLLATGKWNGTVKGINDLNREYRAKYGPGEYAPVVAVTYWSFRAMIGAATALILLTALTLLLLRRRRPLDRRYLLLLTAAVALPFIANSAGWIFTEMGRQPWVVQGLLRTADASSPTVDATSIVLSMVGFTVLYGILGAIGLRLFVRTANAGPDKPADDGPEGPRAPGPPSPDLVLTY
jgi:cytochrome d ubiquinol oxidase subunit I